jgi:hypothetical protein
MTDPSRRSGPSDAGPLDRDRARRNPEDAENDVDSEPDDVPPSDGSDNPSWPSEPAFAIDVDPEDQGSSDVAPRNPD